MLYPLPLLVTLASLLNLSSAASLRIKIGPSTLLANPNTLPSSTHATLTADSGEVIRGLLRQDNTIYFPDIPTVGSHLLDIHTRDYVFAPYRIDTTTSSSTTKDAAGVQISGAWETYRGTLWSDRGVGLLPANSPTSSLTISAKILGGKNFYEDRPAFSPLSLLKNPMILMGGVALLFTFGMPKLMENMDPEMKAEYEEMQKKGPVSSLMGRQGPSTNPAADFDLAGYLAGSGKSGGSSGGAAAAGGGGSGAVSSGRDAVDGIRERRR